MGIFPKVMPAGDLTSINIEVAFYYILHSMVVILFKKKNSAYLILLPWENSAVLCEFSSINQTFFVLTVKAF